MTDRDTARRTTTGRTSDQFNGSRGVTMEKGNPIKTVSTPPKEPAIQPSSPAPSADPKGTGSAKG